jgi:CRP/FNR family cyclic AMP-dependent transcriptional regulator
MKHLLTRNSRVEEDLIDQFKVRNGSLAFSSCLQTLEKKVTPRRSIQASIKKRWPKIIGTTRSCVNSLLNKFRELGLINYNGKI